MTHVRVANTITGAQRVTIREVNPWTQPGWVHSVQETNRAQPTPRGWTAADTLWACGVSLALGALLGLLFQPGVMRALEALDKVLP